jgi:uncharacterized protein (TIGR02646 family)
MIKQLISKPKIPKYIQRKINALNPLTGGEWNDNNLEIKEFKSLLKSQLLIIQKDKCAYCSLFLNETSREEIEHIAPKGGNIRPKYPDFTFTVCNLVLACSLCNGPTKKGMKDSIERKSPHYKRCKFKIVHPYFDDHSLHYSWTDTNNKTLIQGISTKGFASIKMFKLNSSQQTEARVRLKLKEYLTVIPGGKSIIEAALAYNP